MVFLCYKKNIIVLKRESSFPIHKRSAKEMHVVMRNFTEKRFAAEMKSC
ncbi:hypothetical protein RUMHYD_03533 [Blautia hydrogenotrophica DSM 10507]|uniref:Uncharacterized protein n=1 Tax=Blautia hydrogenotrophica (strain DSM 10507 / JCM 14656 / S5a33) TaxID=476272 RepID=C0CRL9_BLAHS|nr:hypothetical protein RUMHYD_03533 [Blautia hydrogenotrophica DSM 10507]